MIHPVADTDDDPTSQMPWPAARSRLQSDTAVDGGTSFPTTGDGGPVNSKNINSPAGRRMLSTWNLITLTIAMGGSQMAWTVELGYGTPFLLSLGLTEHLTALVWLAGPISGLIAQPVIGALSDASSSKYRRRFWIVLSTTALVISTFTLAYCQDLANFFVDLAGVGPGDWSKKRGELVKRTAIGFAVVSFYVLDFALNGLQASLRNLLLDVAPPGQLNAGNAWHGRMTHAGNLVSFGFGFLSLADLPIIRLIGGDQFRKLCVITIVILIATVWITCACHHEEGRPRTHSSQGSSISIREVFNNIFDALTRLPKPIRRVCYVQLFAFMGWFPFAFYSTTYVGQIMAYEQKREPLPELVARTGEFAMLIYSVVCIAAGTILPHLAVRDQRLLGDKADVDETAEISRPRATVREWRINAAGKGRAFQLPLMPFLLRDIWTGALVFFSLLMLSTFFVSTVFQATICISLVGICWAVAVWVPSTIIMELLAEPVSPAWPVQETRRPILSRNFSTPAHNRHSSIERQPLTRWRSFDEYDNPPEEDVHPSPLPGGTVLGLHTLAIVTPQFIVAVVTSIIFKVVDGDPTIENQGELPNTYLGKNGVAWVLRFGGFCALFGAFFAQMIPPTPTEKAIRRRVREIKRLGEEINP